MDQEESDAYALWKALRCFTVSDLQGLVWEHLQMSTNWSKVLDEANITDPSKINRKKANLLDVLVDKFQYKISSSREPVTVRQMVAQLELYYVTKHASRKNWHVFQLLDSIPNSRPCHSPAALEKVLNNAFSRKEYEPEVNTCASESALWTRVVLTKMVRRTKKSSSPVYIVSFISQPYFYCSRARLPEDVKKVFVRALNYRNVKQLQLSGPHIMSLQQLLRSQEVRGSGRLGFQDRHTAHALTRHIPFKRTYEEAGLVDGVIDESKGMKRRRKEYAAKVFGEDPPVLRRFSIKASGPLSGSDIPPTMLGKDFNVTITFTGNHVFQEMKKMIELGIFESPLPPALENVIDMGRNNIILRRREINSSVLHEQSRVA